MMGERAYCMRTKYRIENLKNILSSYFACMEKLNLKEFGKKVNKRPSLMVVQYQNFKLSIEDPQLDFQKIYSMP